MSATLSRGVTADTPVDVVIFPPPHSRWCVRRWPSSIIPPGFLCDLFSCYLGAGHDHGPRPYLRFEDTPGFKGKALSSVKGVHVASRLALITTVLQPGSGIGPLPRMGVARASSSQRPPPGLASDKGP
eukprot:3161362-Pyramimonas_sp.AAC.1